MCLGFGRSELNNYSLGFTAATLCKIFSSMFLFFLRAFDCTLLKNQIPGACQSLAALQSQSAKFCLHGCPSKTFTEFSARGGGVVLLLLTGACNKVL
jgi:hypothetical protein